MSNPYYTHVFNPPQGSANRSRPVISEFTLVQQGFDAVYVKVASALRLPDGVTLSAMPAITAADYGKSVSIAGDGSGFVYTTQATSSQMDAAIAAAATASAAASAASVSAATVAGSTNALQMLLVSNGIF
jgi:hypothetical protein